MFIQINFSSYFDEIQLMFTSKKVREKLVKKKKKKLD